MAIREVRIFGDPVLREPAAPVARVTNEVQSLIADMFETMYKEDGVGLAAPQVGVGVRIVVVDPREEGVRPFALLNPEVVTSSEETDRAEEGCLSLPGLKDIVERPAKVTVAGMSPDGETRTIDAEGLLARILQHEVDHLNGVLFIDRVSPLKRRMLLNKWQKLRAAEAEK
jgi:peptide deformylase